MNIIIRLFFIFTSIFFLISCFDKNNSNPKNQNTNINVNYTSYFINSTIISLNYKNFDRYIYDSFKSYLILFTFKRCPVCNNLIRVLENVENYYISKNIKNLKFAKVDCYASSWITMRFDLFTLPAFAYISNGKYSSFVPNSSITEKELINYIENKEKDYKIIPEEVGYFGVFMKIFSKTTDKIRKTIPFWNEVCSWIAIFALLGCFIYFEYTLYKKACCQNNNDGKDEATNENYKEHKKEKRKKFKKD